MRVREFQVIAIVVMHRPKEWQGRLCGINCAQDESAHTSQRSQWLGKARVSYGREHF